jgi:hypothetical protein
MGADNLNDRIESILKNVHCINDLTLDHITEIQALGQTVEIDQFNVSGWEFSNWIEQVGSDIRGIEYDAQTQRLNVKKPPRTQHGSAAQTFVNWMSGNLSDKLKQAIGGNFSSYGDTGK